jgi:hypothetical protein
MQPHCFKKVLIEATSSFENHFEFFKAYIGCYADKTYARDLNGMENDYLSNLSPLNCQLYCTSMGYSYAGLQYGYCT